MAGNGTFGHSGDGGAATQARLVPDGVTSDPFGRSLYIADGFHNVVRRVDASGTITTIAGVGSQNAGGFSGDGGPATVAGLNKPRDVAVDVAGNLYIADTANHRIRKVAPGNDGVVDGGRDPNGNPDPADLETITTVAGGGAPPDGLGDGMLATLARLNNPEGVALDAAGNLYITDAGNHRVRKVSSGTITTVAGGGSPAAGIGDGGAATAAKLASPRDSAIDGAGNLYISDVNNRRIRKVVPGSDGVLDGDETINTVAGNGEAGYSGDGGPATSAQLSLPQGIAVDPGGNVYIADSDSHVVRRVDSSGTIWTAAGTGWQGFSGDGGQAIYAELANPQGMDIDPKGNLLIADRGIQSPPFQPHSGGNRVRRVPISPVWVTTSGYPAVDSEFSYNLRIGPLAAPATGLTLTDLLPHEVTFRQAKPSQGACSQKAGTVTCRLGNLAKGAVANVQMRVRGVTSALATNTATVAANEPAAIPYGPTVKTPTKVSGAGCGKMVKKSTKLTQDIGPCAGSGLIVGADNVTLDLGGRRVFGWPRPDGYKAPLWAAPTAGVLLPMRAQVTVKNGGISSFDAGVVAAFGRGNTLTGPSLTVTDSDAGVVLARGDSNTVTGLTLTDNIGPDSRDAFLGDGIYVLQSSNNLIEHNQLSRNGIYDGIGVWGADADGNTIRNNRIEDTVGVSGGAPFGHGIIVNSFAEPGDELKTIERTIIEGNTILRSASAGIANMNSILGQISGNTVEGSGRTNSIGNGIGVQFGLGLVESDDPEAQALKAAGTRMVIEKNEVHGNGVDGIRIATRGNTIRNNDAGCGIDDGLGCVDNNSNPAANSFEQFRRGFDLHDLSSAVSAGQPPRSLEGSTCGDDLSTPENEDNVWSGNTWGTGFFFPACTTSGGSGPQPTSTLSDSGPPRDFPQIIRRVSEFDQGSNIPL
ncbi:MAG: right-handed parallel beta-helix repeat-containing protein [Actinomycetota bacterium]|nr:right-handed parallel beta-helix repeat-containing protein [Actinomycetota bacterium]